MRQPDITKEIILNKSIKLFNTKGYKSTSISDITTETGFTKGAIYRHFENKEALEIKAFETMMEFIFKIMTKKVKQEINAKDKLFAILDLFESYISNPFIAGGCPLLNLSVEFDHTNSLLKNNGKICLEKMKFGLQNIIIKGQKYNQIKESVDPNSFSIIYFATIEGGIMMSNLNGNNIDILLVVNHLKSWIQREICT